MTDKENPEEPELETWIKVLLSVGFFLLIFAAITGGIAAFVFALRCAWAAGA